MISRARSIRVFVVVLVLGAVSASAATKPTNQTLIGLALVLTFVLMQPVGASIYAQAVQPLQEGQINAMEAVQRGSGPIHQFMVHYVREKDVALFVDLAKEQHPRDSKDLS